MSRGLMAFGGLLEGLGKGIVQQSNDIRARALKQMELDAESERERQRIAAQHTEGEADRSSRQLISGNEISARTADVNTEVTAANTRNAADIASREGQPARDANARKGLIKSTFTTDKGTIGTVSEGGDIKDTGQKTAELPAKTKLELDNAVRVATEEVQVPVDASDPSGQQKTVKQLNMDKYSAQLRKSKNPDVQALADAPPPPDVLPPDFENTDSPPGIAPADVGSATVTPSGYAPSRRGLTTSTKASGMSETDMKAQADQIRADYKAGKLTKEEANKKLNDLYGQ